MLAWSTERIATGGGVVSCTGQDTEAALYRFALYGDPADLAAAHAATERRIRRFDSARRPWPLLRFTSSPGGHRKVTRTTCAQRLGESAVDAVDEAVCFVQVAPQLGPLAVIMGHASRRRADPSYLRTFDLERDSLDLFVQLVQQRLRLERPGVVGHVGIVSSGS